MFEQAASGVVDGASCVLGGAWRPEPRRPSHEAPALETLLEFVEIKRSEKTDDGGQRNSKRPHSAVFQPRNSQTGKNCENFQRKPLLLTVDLNNELRLKT